MKKSGILLLITILTLFIIQNTSASDVLVWQGQYHTGTTFNTGAFEFNFTVYDSKLLGQQCYSNITTLTTSNFGEWKTEQVGVGTACNNVSQDYFLEIRINNVTQGDRRRLVLGDFLRKDVNEKLNQDIITKGVLKFENTPQIPNTRAITFDINSNGQSNTSAIVMEYNSNGSDLIRHFTSSDLYKWDKNADLYIRDMFSRFLGSITNRITKLFVQDIDLNGSISGTGNLILTGNIRTDGNITVGDKILTNNGCLVPNANFWGERTGSISASGSLAGLQYSFGDGNSNSGLTQPCGGKVVYMTVYGQVANTGNGRIDIVINQGLNSTCNLATPSTSETSRMANCSLSFNAGDTLTPRTTITPSGQNGGFDVSWWVVYD